MIFHFITHWEISFPRFFFRLFCFSKQCPATIIWGMNKKQMYKPHTSTIKPTLHCHFRAHLFLFFPWDICNTLVDLRSLLLRYLQNPVWSVASLSLRSLILGNHKFLHSIWTNHNVWSKKYICCFLILMHTNTYCIEKKWKYPQSTDHHVQFFDLLPFLHICCW